MNKQNREIKSSVFADLFQYCEEAAANALSLFNALNDTEYDDLSKLHHIILKDTIYRSIRNDVSFRYEDRVVVLIEHQSTVNGNMPLRSLMYIGRIFEKLVPAQMRYNKKTLSLPTPEFYVLYNGTDDTEKEYFLNLSDAFKGDSPLELKVKVININIDKKHPLLDKCEVLHGYSQLNEYIQFYKNQGVENPCEVAVGECIRQGILRDYLIREGSEVLNMLIAEYDYDTDIAVQREEAFADGEAKGEELINSLNERLVEDGRMDDLVKSLKDKAFQKELIREYGLEKR